jgi:selenide, water dikinase
LGADGSTRRTIAMMINALRPTVRNIVLVGAGHAHVGVLRSFVRNPIPAVRVTLITREVNTPYSGMLPGLIAGHYTFDDAHIDAARLARLAGAQLIDNAVVGLDLANRLVLCADHPPVPYDICSINIGSTPSARDVPGADANAIPVKPIDGFLQRCEAARARVLKAGGTARIGVVGGGAGGVELLLSLQYRLTRDVAAAGYDPAALKFTLVSGSSDILPTFPVNVRRRMSRVLASRAVTVLTGARVAAVQVGSIDLESGVRIGLDEVFWTTRAAAAPWLVATGLALDSAGFIRVRPTLQAVGHDMIFAVGDVAAPEGSTVPKAGVYAVRAAKPLTENIRRLVAGTPLQSHTPQVEALSLISTGDRYAIGTRNGLTCAGGWVWQLKDYIDRRFMAKFQR